MDNLHGLRARGGGFSGELPSTRRGLGRDDQQVGLTRSGNQSVKVTGRRNSVGAMSPMTWSPQTGRPGRTQRAMSVHLPKTDKAPEKNDNSPKGLLAKITYSMKKLLGGKEHEIEKSGVRFKDSDRGTQVGGYIIQGDKRKGVEPGFVAKKAWMPKDEASARRVWSACSPPRPTWRAGPASPSCAASWRRWSRART